MIASLRLFYISKLECIYSDEGKFHQWLFVRKIQLVLVGMPLVTD